MKDKIGQKIAVLLVSLAISLFATFSSISMSLATQNTSNPILDSSTIEMSYLAKKSENGYGSFSVFSKENATSVLKQTQGSLSAQYYDNLLSFLVCSDNLKTPHSFKIGINQNYLFPSFSLVSMYTFSNTKKFETLNLELLLSLPRSSTVYQQNLPAVYIPDFLADEIIKGDNTGNILTYDQLLSSMPTMTIFDPTGTLSKTFIIANIFHVSGFNYLTGDEKYEGSDDGSGKIISDFVGNYIIAEDDTFCNSLGCSLVNLAGPRQFMYSSLIKSTLSLFDKEDIDFSFFYINENFAVVSVSFDSLSIFCKNSGNSDLISLLWLFLSIFSLLLCVSMFSVLKRKSFFNLYSYLIVSIFPLLYLFLGHICLTYFIVNLNGIGCSFFNIFGSVVALFSIIVPIIFFSKEKGLI